MNQSNYISKVKDIIKSSEGDLDIVESISNLELPPEPTAVESLIYGESKQIEQVKEIFETDEDHDAEDPEAVATTIVSKLKSYIGDFEGGIEYKFSFQLQAHYQHFLETNIATEYLSLTRPITSARSIHQALEELDIWKKDLPKKLPLFKNDKRDCLLISVKPIYQIRAFKDGMVIISDGTIVHGDERDINTRVNNL